MHSGPYVQFAHARLCSIERKFAEMHPNAPGLYHSESLNMIVADMNAILACTTNQNQNPISLCCLARMRRPFLWPLSSNLPLLCYILYSRESTTHEKDSKPSLSVQLRLMSRPPSSPRFWLLQVRIWINKDEWMNEWMSECMENWRVGNRAGVLQTWLTAGNTDRSARVLHEDPKLAAARLACMCSVVTLEPSTR